MKSIILAISLIIFLANDNSKIITSHPWIVESIKIYNGDNPHNLSHVQSIEDNPPFSGQIITFKPDHFCEIKNKGNGIMSRLDLYKWSLDKSGNIIFRNKDSRITDQFTLLLLDLSDDSLLIYQSQIGIETGKKSITVYTFKKVK
jgi:hypothetical protein